ncbi:ABC transporter ATP-binding protein [Actibacterium sp. XHP0104]|uniref:ABC transporter ATP-binding protein n=1 Tax=Actibacterium sp. XHP0104 TaxID=2984335 RepID=UPI003994C537
MLTLSDLTVRRGDCPVVDHVSLTVRGGEFVGLIGPNGAGKTTLMRGALGLLPATGHSSLAALPARDRARAAAWLPQMREIAWPVDVETVVALGRTPHIGARGLSDADRAEVDKALHWLDLDAFRHRTATQLSGGEQARVLIARTLAQGAPLVLADEPIAGLDPAHQIATMQVFRDLADQGRAVIASLHDLGLAARLCTRLVLLGQGRVVAEGAPRDVLTEANLREVFHLRAHYADTPDGPVFQPLEVIR